MKSELNKIYKSLLLKRLEEEYKNLGYNNRISKESVSIFDDLNLKNDEYIFDYFDIKDIKRRMIEYDRNKYIDMASLEFSILCYSETLKQFYSRIQKIIIITDMEEYKYNGNEPKKALFDIYKDYFDESTKKYFNGLILYNRATIEKYNDVLRELIKSGLIGKSMNEFKKKFISSRRIPFLYGFAESFSNIDVSYDNDGKYFDYITVEGYMTYPSNNKDRIEFIKSNKKGILKMYLGTIRRTAKWKNLDLPINILKLDDLVLTNSGVLIAKFSVKETSQS